MSASNDRHLGTSQNPLQVETNFNDGAVTTAKLADGSVTGPKINASEFMRFLMVTAKDASSSAQADTATGAKVGDTVLSVMDLTDLTDVTSDFEATISVDDQIQQTAGSLNTKKCLVILLAQS